MFRLRPLVPPVFFVSLLFAFVGACSGNPTPSSQGVESAVEATLTAIAVSSEAAPAVAPTMTAAIVESALPVIEEVTPTPEPLIKLYVQNVRTGQAAFDRVVEHNAGHTFLEYLKPDEGYQYVTLDLIVEGPSNFMLWSPSKVTGVLIDSGGFQRDFWCNLGIANEYQDNYGQALLPGVRLREYAELQIPANQNPAALLVSFDGLPEVYSLDLTNPQDDLVVPFDRATWPRPAKDVLDTTFSQSYRITHSNFSFEPDDHGLFIFADRHIENIGGYDLTFQNWGPGIVMVDSSGYYYDTFPEPGRGLAPGLSDDFRTFLFALPNSRPKPDWIALFHLADDLSNTDGIILDVP